MENNQTRPATPDRFIIDPVTLVMHDTETGDRFAYVAESGKEVNHE